MGVSQDAHHPHTVSIFLWDSCLVPGASTTQTLLSASGHRVRERERALKTETEREGRRRRDGNRNKPDSPSWRRQTDRSGREAWGLFSLGKKKQTATLLVFFLNQQGLWRCQQMHNATGRHLVADRQLSTTHTHVYIYNVCNGAVFFLHT